MGSYSVLIKCTYGFILFCFFACGKNGGASNEKPATILSEEKFTKLLADFALAESAGNLNIKGVHLQKVDSVYAFDPLKENNVRKSQYDSTILYYSNHTEEYKKIYENVLIMLSEKEAKRSAIKTDTSIK